MHFDYRTENTCSQFISFDMEGNVVRNIEFFGGCDGNLKAIQTLVDGWTVEQIEAKLRGITCGEKSTSCNDQLSRAVRAAYDAQKTFVKL